MTLEMAQMHSQISSFPSWLTSVELTIKSVIYVVSSSCRKTTTVPTARTLATPASVSPLAQSLEPATPSPGSAPVKEESSVVSVTAVITPSLRSLHWDARVCGFYIFCNYVSLKGILVSRQEIGG